MKRFLVQLDKEIEEDGKRSSVQIAELEAALADKDSIIDELNMSLSKQGPNPQTEDEYVFFLEDENDKLERIVAGQEKDILELEEKSNNLQAALALLQASRRNNLWTILELYRYARGTFYGTDRGQEAHIGSRSSVDRG